MDREDSLTLSISRSPSASSKSSGARTRNVFKKNGSDFENDKPRSHWGNAMSTFHNLLWVLALILLMFSFFLYRRIGIKQKFLWRESSQHLIGLYRRGGQPNAHDTFLAAADLATFREQRFPNDEAARIIVKGLKQWSQAFANVRADDKAVAATPEENEELAKMMNVILQMWNRAAYEHDHSLYFRMQSSEVNNVDNLQNISAIAASFILFCALAFAKMKW